jgi:hypothetical protein
MFTFARRVAVAALSVGVLAGGATMASAAVQPAPHGVVFNDPTVHTHLVNRDDSGDAGTWAQDNFWRTTHIYHTGLDTYKVTITDNGKFVTDPGALTPNQGAPYTGETIAFPHLRGYLHGSWSWTLTSLTPPNVHGIPTFIFGDAYSTSTWYLLAFPTATGVTEASAWAWDYDAVAVHYHWVLVHRHHHHSYWVRVPTYTPENWLDAESGQAGNIQG